MYVWQFQQYAFLVTRMRFRIVNVFSLRSEKGLALEKLGLNRQVPKP